MTSVDLFYLHWPDHETQIEETLSAVQELYKSMHYNFKTLILLVLLYCFRGKIQGVRLM